MKQIKKLLSLLVLVFCHYFSLAQGHIPQTPAVSFSLGKSSISTSFGAGYTYFLNHNLFLSGQGHFEYGEAHQFKFQLGSVNLLANHSFLNLNGNFYLNGGAGLSIAYENIQPKPSSAFNIGGIIRGEAETFIRDAVSISLWLDQAFMARNDIGNLRSRYGLALRLFF